MAQRGSSSRGAAAQCQWWLTSPPTHPVYYLVPPHPPIQIVGNEVFEDGYVPVVCGLSRANEKDILRAWDAVKGAKLPRVHTFIATSPIHMEFKLKKTPDEVVAIAVNAVKFTKSLGCDDIEFSPGRCRGVVCGVVWGGVVGVVGVVGGWMVRQAGWRRGGRLTPTASLTMLA